MKIYLEKLWHKKDCVGWAWHLQGKRYAYQPANDLGLFGEDWNALKEAKHQEIILRKIEVMPKKYLYILKNVYKYWSDEDYLNAVTIPTAKALIKESYGYPRLDHEIRLCEKYWS